MWFFSENHLLIFKACAVWRGLFCYHAPPMRARVAEFGRRTGLRIRRGNPWGFESPLSHQFLRVLGTKGETHEQNPYFDGSHPGIYGCGVVPDHKPGASVSDRAALLRSAVRGGHSPCTANFALDNSMELVQGSQSGTDPKVGRVQTMARFSADN